MNKYRISPIDNQDEDGQLIQIWSDSVRVTHNFLTAGHFDFYRAMLQDSEFADVDLYGLYICNADGQKDVLAGFIGIEGKKIEMLFISPAFFRQGLGTVLLRYALGRGCNSVDVNEQNTGAYAFYRKMGFIEKGRSELDGSGLPYPILHLKLVDP